MCGQVDLNNVEAIILGPESLVRAYEAELSSMPALKVIVGLSEDAGGSYGHVGGYLNAHVDDPSSNPTHLIHNQTPPNSGTITFRGLFTIHPSS